jgi:hypothetical protein
MERLEAATDDSSPLLLILRPGESSEARIARYEAEHGPIPRRRIVLCVSEADALL